MHQAAQPDGCQVTDWRADDRSGLIWPIAPGWGFLSAMIQWEPGGYVELRDRFTRDPLGLYGPPDSTATDHRPPSRGMQSFTKVWQMKVHPSTPLGLLVAHDDDVPRRVTLAEFKLVIHTEGA
ncbi:hypothetical protein [Streptomyces himalayensis]|nr:hypothetical protein [Streptomyces himalayensis]